MQHGGLGLGTLLTLWIPLLQSLGTPLRMLPLCRLNLGSLYLTFIATSTPSVIIGPTFGKTIISSLIANISSTPLDILMPLITALCSTT